MNITTISVDIAKDVITSAMDQRTQFIADYLREVLTIIKLCELYGVSRKTGYKWIDHYIHLGPAGSEEGSRRPQHSPNQTAPEIIEALLAARHRHPTWSAKKLLPLLHKRHPSWTRCLVFRGRFTLQ